MSEEIGMFKSDLEGDVRGMAIKLKNIEGDTVASDEEDSQDLPL